MIQTEYKNEVGNPGTNAQIFEHEVLDVIASKEAGERVMKIEPRIRIIAAGTSDIFCAPITDTHKERFPGLWELYLAAKQSANEEEPVKKPRAKRKVKANEPA